MFEDYDPANQIVARTSNAVWNHASFRRHAGSRDRPDSRQDEYRGSWDEGHVPKGNGPGSRNVPGAGNIPSDRTPLGTDTSQR